jgi:hypothetical protein
MMEMDTVITSGDQFRRKIAGTMAVIHRTKHCKGNRNRRRNQGCGSRIRFVVEMKGWEARQG